MKYLKNIFEEFLNDRPIEQEEISVPMSEVDYKFKFNIRVMAFHSEHGVEHIFDYIEKSDADDETVVKNLTADFFYKGIEMGEGVGKLGGRYAIQFSHYSYFDVVSVKRIDNEAQETEHN